MAVMVCLWGEDMFSVLNTFSPVKCSVAGVARGDPPGEKSVTRRPAKKCPPDPPGGQKPSPFRPESAQYVPAVRGCPTRNAAPESP